MSDPSDQKIDAGTSRLVLVRNNLLAAMVVFALLECWRPCFFLTDDNLDGGLPFFTEMGQRMLRGETPFMTEYLFGGGYDLLRDATFFLWHPVYLLASLLAGTPFYYTIIDVCAFVFSMVSVAGFANLAWYLREEGECEWSDGWIMFFCLSFNFSLIAMTTEASWLNYMVNNSALPWLALGILQRKWGAGLGLIALFSLHQVLGGHPLAMISNVVFLSLFAGGVCLYRGSWAPLACWMGGSAAAFVVALPLLLPMLGGFFHTERSQGVELWDMNENKIPGSLFPTSIFFGMALWIIHPPHQGHIMYMVALGSCAAAWCLVPAALNLNRWRGLQGIVFALVAFGALMVVRPRWVSEIMIHIPVLRATRWPFRELVQFQFFLHFFLLVRPGAFSPPALRFNACWSAFIMIVPMLFYIIPPTLNEMPIGRRLVVSGDFDRYWAQVRPLLKPTDRVAVLTTYAFYTDDRYEKPNGLLGSFNYDMLAHVVNAAGYSHTAPLDQLYTKTIPYFPNGSYDVSQRAALELERPDLKFITLESLHPVRITLSSKNGPTIDLTPYVPARFQYR